MMLTILSELTGMVSDHFRGRREIAQAETKSKISRLERLASADIDYDITALENSGGSWKDEWFTILLSIPAIICFIPGGADIATQGFEALSTSPEYYRWGLTGAISASFGLRGFNRFAGGSKK